MRLRWAFLTALMLPTLCGAAPFKVVTSFTILQDFVQKIGDDYVEVSAIVGPNSDAHIFEPTPQTVTLLTTADLVVINGLGFEAWFDRLKETSGYIGPVCVATDGIQSRTLTQDGHLQHDPHAWLSVPNAKIYIQNIEKALSLLDPIHKDTYQRNAAAYIDKLEALDLWIRESLAPYPQNARVVITAHDAFFYFATEYKVKVLAPVGISTQVEPSAWNMAALIQQIKALGIKTLFVENMTNPKLINQLADETGASLGETLYSDALSEKNEPAPTYLTLMRHNVTLLGKAMSQMNPPADPMVALPAK
ncbi:MAG: zinc ABC transporter substrate-binding protein [Alphaproteobacteria bacterium]|nr:zinc ABC transporter substrate-binding protein [Alphaproteobacteria bacterium]